MDHSASVFDASENEEELLVEPIRTQDSPASLQIPEQLTSESLLHSVQSIEAMVDHLVIRMQAIGEEYLERVHSAAIAFRDRVDRSVRSTRFSRRYESTVDLEIKNAENVFGRQIVDAAAEMKGWHEMLSEEIESLKGRWSGEVFEQIIQTETLVLNEDVRIQGMIQDPNVELGDLGRLMRAYAKNRELKAYLQGLKFRVRERLES